MKIVSIVLLSLAWVLIVLQIFSQPHAFYLSLCGGLIIGFLHTW